MNRLVLLGLLCLHGGAVGNPGVFEEVHLVDQAQIDELLEAIDCENEEFLLSIDCSVVAAAFVKSIQGVFLSAEECVRGAQDWSKAEEAMIGFSGERLNNLVFLAAFFRMFRSSFFDVMSVVFGAEHPQIQAIQDFFALFVRHMPPHGIGESAAGWNVLVTSKNSRKQAKGVVLSVDKTDKIRYLIKLSNGQQVLVKSENMEWLTWGPLEDEIPLLKEAFLIPWIVSNNSGMAHPLTLMLQYYDGQQPLELEQKLLEDSSAVIAFIDSVENAKKQCLVQVLKVAKKKKKKKKKKRVSLVLLPFFFICSLLLVCLFFMKRSLIF